MQEVVEIKILVTDMRMYFQIDESKINKKMPKCDFKHAVNGTQYYEFTDETLQTLERVAKELTYLIRYNKIFKPDFEKRSWREAKNIISR